MTHSKSSLSTTSPSPLARYESFLIQNSSTIGTIESSLRSLTWFLPGRFKDAELASESLTAVLNLMSLYHDTLLARRLNSTTDSGGKPKPPLIPPTEHSRYTRAWTDKRAVYKYAARALEVIRFVQLVVEMTLRRRAAKAGGSMIAVWRVIVALEAVKATLRLTILRVTRRPLLFPPIPERDIDPTALGEAAAAAAATASSTSVKHASPDTAPRTPDHIRNNRMVFPPTPPSEPSPLLLSPAQGTSAPLEVDQYLLSRALTPAAVKPPTTLLKPLASPKDWLSEVIYVIRPLVYVVAVARMKARNEPSSRPLVISIALDLVSRYLRRTPSAAVTTIERSEYARRDRDMLWYLLRGTIWEEYTRPKISGLADRTSGAPILGIFGALVKDWMPLIDDYYYYTSV